MLKGAEPCFAEALSDGVISIMCCELVVGGCGWPWGVRLASLPALGYTSQEKEHPP